jgi:hypothetical protein
MQIRQNPPPPSGLQSPQLFTEELRKSWTALNDANVAVYPVDANGLLTSKGSESINTMRLIADQTGGKAYFNGSDLAGEMRSAMDDGRVSYTVGFYVAAADLDGKFHDIKVKVARSGVELGHRSGYWATEELPRSDRQIEEDLRTAAARPLEITELGVSARGDMLPGDAPACASRFRSTFRMLALRRRMTAGSANSNCSCFRWARMALASIQRPLCSR